MEITDVWIFNGYTYFKLDKNRITENIEKIEIDGKQYKAVYPYDAPYCLAVKGEIETSGKSIKILT